MVISFCQVEAINEYLVSMKISGYSEKVRRETIIAAFKGMERKVQEARDEGKPLNRHKSDGERDRFRKKITMKSRWFKKSKKNQPKNSQGFQNAQPRKEKQRRKPPKIIPPTTSEQDDREVENVIFVPYTRGGVLRTTMQKEDDQDTRPE